jgi:predicted alpha/beta hydrolase family esterase
MKSAWLLHGTGGSDNDYFWFDSTKSYLESKGYNVWWPLLPHTEKPELVETKAFIESNMPSCDKETIIIGHSSACPVILSLMQSFKTPVKQVILVSGFYQPLNDDGYSNRMLEPNYNWGIIKQVAHEIILINSDNDPWGCDDKQAKPIPDKLKARLIVATGQGHMGSSTYNQPYKEFDLLKQLLKTD